MSGSYMPGVKVTEKPCRVITINRAEATTWSPIISEFVNLQRKTTRRESAVNKGTMEITIPVTIPMPQLLTKSWTELIDEFMMKKFEDDEISTPEEAQQKDAPNKK